MKHHYTVTLGLRAIGFLSCCLAFATCLVLPSPAMSGPSAKEVEVNGARLHYVEEGSGDPMIVVHGGASDLRTWEPLRERIAAKYRFIAYTQRYFGTGPWPDEGQNFSVATHADDLAKFITSLNAGPVHLVGWSYGGTVATVAAVKNPSLVRSLIVYESGLVSVLSEESVEGKAAREDRAKIFGPAIAAAKAGDAIQAAKLLREGVMQLGPGGFDREPQATQTRVLDNARTVPLAFAAPPSPAITCDMLKNFARPTLVMRGDKTQPYFALISDAISKCVPAARLDVLKNVHHGGPHQDPAAFTAAVFEFLSQRAFLIAPAMSPGAQQ